MDGLAAFVLGLVEGVTEFLPVSSTGHLIVVSRWLGIEQTSVHVAFEIIIQLAAILALFATYREKFTPRHVGLWARVLVAFLPLAVVGFLFKDPVEASFANDYVVPVMFIVGGGVFLVVERIHTPAHETTHDLDGVTWRQALWIGVAQLFALIPGTSRAGSTIVGALLVGIDRKVSAQFSFLLALPVMGATSGYALLEHFHEFAGANWGTLGIGFVTAFLTAWGTMKLFVSFLERFTFVAFGVYRILFGALLIWLL